MQIFRKVQVNDRWYIKMLVCNSQIWSPHQWKYRYFKETGYPTSKIEHATAFPTENDVTTKLTELMLLMDEEIPAGYGPRKSSPTYAKPTAIVKTN